MVPVAYPPQELLARWEADGQLQPKSFLTRIDEAVLGSSHGLAISPQQLSKLDPYCLPTQPDSGNNEPALNLSGFKALLKHFVPDIASLDAAAPVLWQLFTYASSYPFFFHDPQQPASRHDLSLTLTQTEFLRALAFLHPYFTARLFNSDNDDDRTRPRTTTDYRRLLFQALAVPQPHQYCAQGTGVLVRDEPCHKNTPCNRDQHGDECFHDLVDFLYAFQPFEPGPPVSRKEWVGVAKGMVERGEVVLMPLHEVAMPRSKFETLVEFLLVMYLEGSVEDLKELPLDFVERKDKVVAAFYGYDGKETVDFCEFSEALSAGSHKIIGGKEFITNEFPELLKALEWILDTYILSLLKT